MSYTLWTDKSWAETQTDLADTFAKWGVTEWETNHPRGANKLGYVQSPTERAVRLTYYKNGHQINLVMDKQRRAVDNLRVLYLAVEAMRLNEKRGIAEVLQSAYLQLEAPTPKRSPYEILGIMPDAPLAVAEAAYRARARTMHPDQGGSVDQFKELNEAIGAIRKQSVT
jgi:DnaJ domain